VHWSLPDPSAADDAHTASYPAFQRTAEELSTRIGYLLHSIAHTDRRKAPGT
jgi:hypothetical protein